MKIASSLLALLFLLFAFVQLNDPDPILWILIYLAMVAVCVGSIFNKYNKIAMAVMAVGYVIYGIILFPGLLEWLQTENKSLLFDDIAKMQHLYIEESREFLGLTICLLVLAIYWTKSQKSKASQAS